MVRVFVITGLLLTASLLALATPGEAAPLTVGDCNKFSGACVGACVEDSRYDCHGEAHTACIGVSYQVPLCIPRIS